MRHALLRIALAPNSLVFAALAAIPLVLEALHFDLDNLQYPFVYAAGQASQGVWTERQAQEWTLTHGIIPLAVILLGILCVFAAAAVALVVQSRIRARLGYALPEPALSSREDDPFPGQRI